MLSSTLKRFAFRTSYFTRMAFKKGHVISLWQYVRSSAMPSYVIIYFCPKFYSCGLRQQQRRRRRRRRHVEVEGSRVLVLVSTIYNLKVMPGLACWVCSTEVAKLYPKIDSMQYITASFFFQIYKSHKQKMYCHYDMTWPFLSIFVR